MPINSPSRIIVGFEFSIVANNSSLFCCFHGVRLRMTSGKVWAGNPGLSAFSLCTYPRRVGVGFRDALGVSASAPGPDALLAILLALGIFPAYFLGS